MKMFTSGRSSKNSELQALWSCGFFPEIQALIFKQYTSLLTLLLLQRSKSVKMLIPRVYLLHLKVKHCQTLRVVRTFTGQNESTVFDW